jgi:hypothetical protein
MSTPRTLIPIYTSRGDLGAYLSYPYLFNCQGEWIGWVNAKREVFSVAGVYVGWLAEEGRILRRESEGYDRPRAVPPTAPARISVPSNLRLAPMMPELTYGIIDLLDERPDLLPPLDLGVYEKDLE